MQKGAQVYQAADEGQTMKSLYLNVECFFCFIRRQDDYRRQPRQPGKADPPPTPQPK
jgi:hypothetical protein